MHEGQDDHASEELGDFAVFGGLIGLIAGLICHAEWIGIATGLALGAVVDMTLDYRRIRTARVRSR
jgi:uncharacterized membrane protein